LNYQQLGDFMLRLANSKEAAHHYYRLAMEYVHCGPALPGENMNAWRYFAFRMREMDREGALMWLAKVTV
jgi:hypothetical protein